MVRHHRRARRHAHRARQRGAARRHGGRLPAAAHEAAGPRTPVRRGDGARTRKASHRVQLRSRACDVAASREPRSARGHDGPPLRSGPRPGRGQAAGDDRVVRRELRVTHLGRCGRRPARGQVTGRSQRDARRCRTADVDAREVRRGAVRGRRHGGPVGHAGLFAAVAAVVVRFRRAAHADGRRPADADRRVQAFDAATSGAESAVCIAGCGAARVSARR